tara:strand:- start:8082 stop:8915 length:834 start_codon:yes stop_codon:yes gene_type:complete
MQATSIRNAVVSGAASGLGEDISAALVAEGYRVFGTTLDEESAGDRDGIVLSKVDVSDPAAVRAWAADVAAATGGSVDLLISNAGILTPGPLEVIPFEDIVREFEVNTFGPLHLVNAFLPQLREAQGRIVQISSISAVYPVPFNAPSAASKAAAEALLIAYRAELSGMGIDVTIIQAGSMLTGGPAKSAAALSAVAEAFTPEQRALYGESFARFTARFNGVQGLGMPSADAARQVVAIAQQQPAPSAAPLGDDAAAVLESVRTSTPEQLDASRLAFI